MFRQRTYEVCCNTAENQLGLHTFEARKEESIMQAKCRERQVDGSHERLLIHQKCFCLSASRFLCDRLT